MKVGWFASSPDVAEAMRAAAADRRMALAAADVRPDGLEGAVEAAARGAEFALIVAEAPDVHDAELFALLDALSAGCVPGTKVILLGTRNDVGLYRSLMAYGISDYLVRPVPPQAILAAASAACAGKDGETAARVVAFVGARGGAGSSTLAHNVACAASEGGRVFLADLDMRYGTAGLDFNMEPKHGVAEAMRLSEPDGAMLERMSARHGDSLLVLASRPGGSVDAGPEEVEAFVTAAASGGGLVVLDMPISGPDSLDRALAMSDEIVLTAVPDLASMRNAKHLVQHLARLRPNDPPPRLVFNQAGMGGRPEVKDADFAAATGLSPAARIAFDPAAFGQAANEGVPLFEKRPRHAASRAFARLAREVGGSAPQRRRKIAGFLRRLAGRSA